jgi:hypothetical protein
LIAQIMAEGLALIEQPGVHRRGLGVLDDEVEPHGQDAEQQVAVGGYGGFFEVSGALRITHSHHAGGPSQAFS